MHDQLIAREGTGHKSDPLRYWLPEREAAWRASNPLYDLDEQHRQKMQLPLESLRARRKQARR